MRPLLIADLTATIGEAFAAEGPHRDDHQHDIRHVAGPESGVEEGGYALSVGLVPKFSCLH